MPSTGVPLTDMYADAGTMSGPSFPSSPATLVKITFSGSTKRMYNTDEPYNSPPHTNGEVIGTYGPDGYAAGGGTCYYGVIVRYNSADVTPTGGCAGGGGSTPIYLLVSGAGTVRRGAAPDYHQCGPTHTDHCERFEDQSLSVAIEPVQADLKLTVEPSTIDSANAGVTIHFSVTALPATAGGDSIPLAVTSWIFTPDGGGSAINNFVNSRSMNWRPPKSGVMCATANVNGATRTRCKHVNVVHCPVSDSLLNDPAMRDSLHALLTDGMNDPLRRERGGVRFRDTVYGQLRYARIIVDSVTNCRLYWRMASHSSNEVVDALLHSHNYGPLDWFVCEGETDSVRYNPGLRGGGSDPDWNTVRAVTAYYGYPIPSYAIDTVAIYRFDASADSGNEEAFRQEWRRTGAGCYVNYINH